MKKYLLVLPVLALLFFAPQTRAGQCFGETPADYYVKVVSGVNLRDAVCNGQVIGSLTTGTVVHAIGDLDGWVQVEHNGQVGFVWGDFVTPIASPNPVVSTEKEDLWDVGDHVYKEAIWSLYELKIVHGNPDKSYQPDTSINRAEFSKIAIGATASNIPKRSTGCLKDIEAGAWYTDFICYANSTFINNEPIIAGHPDGFFRPADNIRFSELAKITSLLYGLEIQSGEIWYEGYIQALSDINAIPPSIKTPAHFVSRAEMAEVIDRLIHEDITRSSTKFNYNLQSTVEENETSKPEELITTTEEGQLSACIENALGESIDVRALQAKALEWTNKEREERNLTLLDSSEALNASSTIWALNGEFSHQRPGGRTLETYQNDIGIHYLQFGENLGGYSFPCTQADCTQEAIEAMEKVHQLFMDEESLPEGQRGHLENITGDFEEMGFGLSVQEGKMLLVFQYGKGIEADEDLLCKYL